MPRIDELLGVATVAAAAMFVAIALQPVPSGAAVSGTARGDERTIVADRSNPAPIILLPSVDVVARRSIEIARIEREDALDRQRLTKGVSRPGA